MTTKLISDISTSQSSWSDNDLIEGQQSGGTSVKSLWSVVKSSLKTYFDTLYGATVTQTFTNKRITKRITTLTTSATPTINTDNCDMVTITALSDVITSMTTNLSGTPTIGQSLIIRFLDAGVAKGITWGSSFASRGATLPTTTVAGKYLYVGFLWNAVASTWDCVAVANEA